MRKHKFDEELMQTRDLAYCTVCKGGEGDLTTECPGFQLPTAVRVNIFNGLVDYKDGSWWTRRTREQDWHKAASPSVFF